jgi:hypothetical protein
MAAAGLTITYGELARLLELLPPNTIHQITVGLERLMEEDAEAGRPFIAALVRQVHGRSEWSGGSIFPRNRAECGTDALGWVCRQLSFAG